MHKQHINLRFIYAKEIVSFNADYFFFTDRRIGFFSFWDSKLFGSLMEKSQGREKVKKDELPPDAEVTSPVIISASVVADSSIENLKYTVNISFKVFENFSKQCFQQHFIKAVQASLSTLLTNRYS